MTLTVSLGDTVELTHSLEDGGAGGNWYPQCEIRDDGNTLLTTVDLAVITPGLYGAQWTPTVAGQYRLWFITYSNVGHTTVSRYAQLSQNLQVGGVLDLTSLLDTPVCDHLIEGSVGEALLSAGAQGLLNYLDDLPTYLGPPGQPTKFRRRVFDSKALADAATLGAALGADGECAAYELTGTYSGTGPTDTLQSMKAVRIA